MWLDWTIVIGCPTTCPSSDMAGVPSTIYGCTRLGFARSGHVHVQRGRLPGRRAKKCPPKRSRRCCIRARPGPVGNFGWSKSISWWRAVRNIVRRYRQDHRCSISLRTRWHSANDTHPTLAIIELMRIFIDEHDLNWERAWALTTGPFGYTNHTLLPEALERWPVSLFERVLPRHLEIVYEINRRFLQQVTARSPNDLGRMARMSIIEEGPEKNVRMAHLAIVGRHSVNGVAAVHSELVKTELVPDFFALRPEKFINKTNEVTPRRWLATANRGTANLITDAIGPGWVTDLDRLRDLSRWPPTPGFGIAFWP